MSACNAPSAHRVVSARGGRDEGVHLAGLEVDVPEGGRDEGLHLEGLGVETPALPARRPLPLGNRKRPQRTPSGERQGRQ